MRRDWSAARAKVEREGKCRLCPRRDRLEAAHTIGRRYDKPRRTIPDGVVWVDPDDVIPLCPQCHLLYDAHKLDVVPVLTYSEQAAAARHVGLVRALHRLTAGQVGLGVDISGRLP